MYVPLANGFFYFERFVLKIVIGGDRLAKLGGSYDRETYFNRFCSLQSTHLYRCIIKDVIGKHLEFLRSIVIVNVNGDDLGCFTNAHAVLADFEKLHMIGGVVANNGALGSVEKGAHGVISFASCGNEDLTNDVVGEFDYRKEFLKNQSFFEISKDLFERSINSKPKKQQEVLYLKMPKKEFVWGRAPCVKRKSLPKMPQ